MIVGYLRKNEKPGSIAKLTSIVAGHYGIKLLYFNCEDIDMDNKKITGKVLQGDKWIEVIEDIPKFIDMKSTLYNFKEKREYIKFLKQHTKVSVDKRIPIPKDQLNHIFNNNPKISKYLIPSIEIIDFKDVLSFLNNYKSIVIKPVFSNQGKNIYKITKDRNKYIVSYLKEDVVKTKKELKEFYDKNISPSRHMAQKFIYSKNLEGHPFDCRVHVEKNGRNRWRNVKNYIRIGVGQSVISNVNQGGGVANIKDFLKANYKENWEFILEEIKELARVLPYEVEKHRNFEYMTLGFDVGIDKGGSLYLFEVNDCPTIAPIKMEVTLTRVKYYRYILNQLKNGTVEK